MNKKIILLLIFFLHVAPNYAKTSYIDDVTIQKYKSAVVFTGGFLSGAITGSLLAIKMLKKKYEKNGGLAENIKQFAKDLIGG